MILFPEAFVQAIILGSLILTGLGAILLIVLFVLDFRNKQIW